MPTKVFVIGVQPPPVHGLSAMNRAVLQLVRARNADTVSIDLSVANTNSVLYIVLRVSSCLTSLLGYIRDAVGHHESVTYIALSGGLGQLFDLIFILAARMCKSRIFLHHHSFAYLDRYRRLTAALVYLAGLEATHIVLGEAMSSALQTRYGAGIWTQVLSNAALLPLDMAETAERTRIMTVGFLSNITTAKGIDDFIEVADAISRAKPQLRFVVAGPISEPSLEERFRLSLAASKNLTRAPTPAEMPTAAVNM